MKEMKLELNGKEYAVKIEEFSVSKAIIWVDDKKYEVGLKNLGIEEASKNASLNLGGAASAPVASTSATPSAQIPQIAAATPDAPKPAASASANAILAPLPGLVLKVLVKVGDEVKTGQNIAIMEAMKMENHVPSTANGKVKEVFVKEGDSVAEAAPLIELE